MVPRLAAIEASRNLLKLPIFGPSPDLSNQKTQEQGLRTLGFSNVLMHAKVEHHCFVLLTQICQSTLTLPILLQYLSHMKT